MYLNLLSLKKNKLVIMINYYLNDLRKRHLTRKNRIVCYYQLQV